MGFKQDWLAALRSGKYKQGKGVLRTLDDEYCCLGVAADVVGAEWQGGVIAWHTDDKSGYLTDAVRAKCGELSNVTQHHLATMNDQGNSFAVIATWIEVNFEETP